MIIKVIYSWDKEERNVKHEDQAFHFFINNLWGLAINKRYCVIDFYLGQHEPLLPEGEGVMEQTCI